jgi:hypothetical protein
VEIERFPYPLDAYSKLSASDQHRISSMLDDLDALLVHLPVLSNQPELFTAVNQRFRVRAAFYDQQLHAQLGPLFLLERHRSASKARRFFEEERVDDVDLYRSNHKLGRSTYFARENGDEDELLTLLGFDVEPIPGSGHQWITYHWFAATDLTIDYRVIDRITGPDDRNSWHNNHFLAYGTMSREGWKKGTVLRESYLLVPSADAFFPGKPVKPLGGAYRRGELIPSKLWIAVLDGDERKGATGGAKQLEVRDATGEIALRKTIDPATLWSSMGWRFSTFGLVQVGAFLLPVATWAKVADDGRALPN